MEDGGAWAPCLGPTGLTLRDWSGRQNHGTLTNMVPGDDWVVSGGRYALDFDGTNDYIPVAFFPPPSGAQCYTFWLNTSSSNQSVIGFSDKLLPDGGGAFDRDVQIDSSGFLQFRMFDLTGSISRYAISTTAVTTGVWTHCAAQFTGASLQMFINGKLESTTTFTTPFNGYTTSFLLFGNEGLFRNFFAGRLDDLRLYSRFLSQHEIRLLATRRGIAYEMYRPTYYAPQTTPARRRKILTGQV